jgi:uncharacterized repeat protein (TIGR01451 family)
MRSSRFWVWFYRLNITAFLILGLHLSSVSISSVSLAASPPQASLAKTSSLGTSLLQSELQNNGEETAYTLHPLAESAQEGSNVGQSYLGLNPAQALRILFSPEGPDVSAQPSGELAWHVGLQLEEYSRQGDTGARVAATLAAASAQAIDNRMQYEYGPLSEWYINEAKGLKHGFTLNQPPSATTEASLLQLRMKVDGSLTPRLSSDGNAIDFLTESGAALLRYDTLYVFDANQRTLPASFSVVDSHTDSGIEHSIVIQVDDHNAVYPITVDPVLTSYLVKQTISDAAPDDFAGYDVNVSQGIAIVGVYGDDNELGVNAGSVYLYAKDEGGSKKWGQRARLVASDGAAGDEFGKDVYVTFGVTVTVGAPGNDEKGDNAGAAYLYAHDQGGINAWGQLVKLTADDGAAGDRFGSAVSLQQHTAVIGAPGSDSGDRPGAVYVYDPTSLDDPTDWSLTKKLVSPDGAVGDRFGAAVVNSGNYIIVGAPGDDEKGTDAGAIYIFERNLGGANQWGLLHKRMAPDGSAGDLFGTSINFSADRVIVGAPGNDEKGNDAGAAYIFERNLGAADQWNARPKIMAPDGAAGDQFGRAVGIGGNIASIGAPFDDDNGENSGSAYLVYFRISSGQEGWDQAVKIIASDGASNDQFGFSADQRSGHIVIGAPKASNTGAIYFYDTPFVLGTMQISTDVEPNDPGTNFEYSIEGLLTHSESIAGDTQTAPMLLFPGTYTITESAGVNTDLSQYSTTWSCTINGDVGPSGNGSTLKVFVGALENVACKFTHVSPGSITIVREAKPDDGTAFNFTDNIAAPNSFTLDSTTPKTFSNVAPGSYSVTETVPEDWRLTGINCVDEDGGTVVNGTTALIDLDANEAVICTFINKAKDGITVVKSADVNIATVGQTITYTYTVINDSQDDLDNVVAMDDKLGSVTLGKTTLVPNEQTTGTLQYTVKSTDLPGPLTNVVLVSGTPPTGPKVTDSASLSINLVGTPAITLTVKADREVATVEDSITYSYRITNTGETPLSDVNAVDQRLGQVPLVDNSLQPGESTSGTLLYSVVEEDLPGPLVDVTTVTGKPPVGPEVEASTSVSVALVLNAGIEVSVQASKATARVGDSIVYTYQVTNSGEATLSDVTATDNRLGSVTLASSSLAPGASTTGTLTYTVLEGDLPGPLTNTVSVTGMPTVGAAVVSQATVSVQLTTSPPTDPDQEQVLNLPLISR